MVNMFNKEYKILENDLIVSCPGKVLLTGGYLVLDQRYQGLVIGVDARFYVQVKTTTTGGQGLCLAITSPQFNDGHWIFEIGPDLNLDTKLNPFIGSAILNTIKYLVATNLKSTVDLDSPSSATTQSSSSSPENTQTSFWEQHAGKRLDITIVADNDFYSQANNVYLSNLA